MASLSAPLKMSPDGTETQQHDGDSSDREVELKTLGMDVPPVPGDVVLSGAMEAKVAEGLADRFKGWLYLNPEPNPAFHREILEKAGVTVTVCPFPGPPSLPTEEQTAAVLDALDALPRPLMIQCNSAMRAGAALMLWLAVRRGYTGASAEQFATDMNLQFFTNCVKCGPMKEWLLQRLPGVESAPKPPAAEGLVFRQLFDPPTSTFTYVLGCAATQEAVLIDPVLEQKDRDLEVLRDMGLKLLYVLNTHCHADHVTSGGMIRKELPEVKTVIAKASGAAADIHVADGDKVSFGNFFVQALSTPGHTDGCVSWLLKGTPDFVFTGDALLIRGCGRTDFQQGDSGMLYESVHSKIFSLDGSTMVYPGHDYKGRNVSTVEEEKRYNTRLTQTKDEFMKTMSELNLPYPNRIDTAVPANMVCGVQD